MSANPAIDDDCAKEPFGGRSNKRGRPKGLGDGAMTPSRLSRAFGKAFKQLGGVTALTAWGKVRPGQFYPTMASYTKAFVPRQLDVKVDHNWDELLSALHRQRLEADQANQPALPSVSGDIVDVQPLPTQGEPMQALSMDTPTDAPVHLEMDAQGSENVDAQDDDDDVDPRLAT